MTLQEELETEAKNILLLPYPCLRLKKDDRLTFHLYPNSAQFGQNHYQTSTRSPLKARPDL